MSRIGRLPIVVPADVDVKIEGNVVTVKGPKGELTSAFSPKMNVELENGHIHVTRPDDTKENRSLHGLTRTLINNMIVGVHTGFEKKLEVVGIGYRAALEGKDLVLNVGHSHQDRMTPPEGITVEVPSPNSIVLKGYDKQKLGQFASEVRGIRPPEPYKGKGIKYADEVVRRKEGKAGKGGK
ncbi:MAG: 50S ribosomal protein L6 [Clostridia bacterium]|jgi:large subunit ribosomal protein L6|nr:50S ribosomal protein L6 [Clostridia bacterium]